MAASQLAVVFRICESVVFARVGETLSLKGLGDDLECCGEPREPFAVRLERWTFCQIGPETLSEFRFENDTVHLFYWTQVGGLRGRRFARTRAATHDGRRSQGRGRALGPTRAGEKGRRPARLLLEIGDAGSFCPKEWIRLDSKLDLESRVYRLVSFQNTIFSCLRIKQDTRKERVGTFHTKVLRRGT